MKRLWLALAVLSLAAPATATTFYVAKTGSNSNTCVQAQATGTAKLTIAAGLACLAAGDTLTIRAGTYTEEIQETAFGAGGSSWATAVTVAAMTGETVTIKPTNARCIRFETFNAISYVIFDRLICDGTNVTNNTDGVLLASTHHHIRFQNGEVVASGLSGFLIEGTFNEILNTRIHHGGLHGENGYAYCVYISSGADNLLDHVTCDNYTGYGFHIYNSILPAPTRNTVRNSIVHHTCTNYPAGSAILLASGAANVAYNNVVYNNPYGIRTAYGSSGALIYNNTIYNNTAYGVDVGENGGSSNIQVKNNIIYASGLGAILNSGSGTQATNNLTTNPFFVNAATSDFHLTSSSTGAIDLGATIATVPDDADGVTRPKGSGYDIGAYEYQPPASPLIATARSLDWSAAGTTIQTRSTICTTLQPPSSSGAINAAIAACGAGQVVKLAAGTFTINGGLNISRNDVTLRGSGPTQTTLALQSYDSCNGLGAGICVTGSGSVPFPPDTPRNLANWTAGFAKGATAITLSSVANLQVGSTIILDQLDDSTPDFNGIANCANRNGAQATWCSGEGANNLSMDSQRVQHETHKVVSIAGNVVTITPGLAWPNWSLSKTPHAWWGSSLPVTGVGIEDLKLDATNEGCGAFFSSCGGILMFYAADSWVKNVEVFKMAISQIKLYESRNITVRDNYIHTSKSQTSGAYGLLLFYSSYVLVENNIFQDIVAGTLLHGVGNVVGYNYMLDDTYNPTGATFPPGNFQMQAGMYHHNGGAGYELWEGNDANSFKADAIHGTSNMTTVFRNRLSGYENLKTDHTNPVFVYAWNRYFNFVGNVLGTSTYHTTSGTYASSFNQVAIFRFGETPNYCPWAGVSGGGCTVTGGFTEARTAATTMRWGNYDTVHAANQFVSAEVPSGDANYPNAVPSSQTLPASFYRGTSAPTWWATPWGTPGYPAIGPDVTGGSIAGLAGHAQKIPARLCYENMSHTTSGSSTGTIPLISNFNADVCYPTTGSPTDTTAPVVTITTNGGTNFTVIDPLLTTLAGGAVDDIQVMFDCRWTNAANAGAGTAPGAFTWSVASIPLALGPNLITVFCHDAANNEGNDTITVTLDQPPPSGPFYRLRIGG